MREAIRSLRLAKLCPELADGGLIVKENRSKSRIHSKISEKDIGKKLDNPTQEFDVILLSKQIYEECVYPDGYGKDYTKWGAQDGNYTHCLSLITRINSVISSAAYKCVFAETTDEAITDITENLLKKRKIFFVFA